MLIRDGVLHCRLGKSAQPQLTGVAATAGCSSSASSTCSGSFRAYSLATYYRFTKRFDAYAGAMYSSVSDGLANGYLYDTTNLNPTIGFRFSF